MLQWSSWWASGQDSGFRCSGLGSGSVPGWETDCASCVMLPKRNKNAWCFVDPLLKP